MQAHLDLLRDVRENGTRKEDRTGTGTLSVFGRQIRFDLRQGFPAVTTKKLFWKGVVAELLWMLRGESNIRSLQRQGVTIWDEWADENGDLGPVYGAQWRGCSIFQPVDQITKVIQEIKEKPNSRRLLVSAWTPRDLPLMALEPCHVMFQFYVHPANECPLCVGYGTTLKTELFQSMTLESPCAMCKGTGEIKARLSLQLYQRSADLFLGVPFNIASYALLTHMVAQVCDLDVGEFIHTFGDAHIYLNHLDQVDEQLSREPRALPQLWINPDIKDIDGFSLDDFRLDGYNPHPAIKAPVAV